MRPTTATRIHPSFPTSQSLPPAGHGRPLSAPPSARRGHVPGIGACFSPSPTPKGARPSEHTPGSFEEVAYNDSKTVPPLHQNPVAIAEACFPHMRTQLAEASLDSLSYWNAFTQHVNTMRLSHEDITPWEAFNTFRIPLQPHHTPSTRGHCGSLSVRLQSSLPSTLRSHSMVVACDLPKQFREPGVVRPGHMALVIPYTHEAEEGFVVLEPGFNIPHGLVVKKDGSRTAYTHEEEGIRYVAYMHPAHTHIVVERHPIESPLEDASAIEDSCINIGLRPVENMDSSVTASMLAVHQTPRIIGRDASGRITAMLVCNLKKQRVEITLRNTRLPPVLFSDIDEEGTCFPAELPVLLHVDNAQKLSARVREVAQASDMFLAFRKWRFEQLGIDETGASTTPSEPVFKKGVFETPKDEQIDFKTRAVPLPGDVLAAHCAEAMRTQMQHHNIDLMSFVNMFLTHLETLRATDPSCSAEEALRSFEPDTAHVMERFHGGNCGVLALDVLKRVPHGSKGYVVASELPTDFEEEGVPVPGHMAAVIPFSNPADPEDSGFVLIEPPFNAPQPVVLRWNSAPVLQHHAGWKETREIVLEGTPKRSVIHFKRYPDGTSIESTPATDETTLHFHTQRFTNYHNAVTLAMVAVNQTPFIFARNEEGAIDTIVRVHLGKRQVEITQAGTRYDPIPFDKCSKPNWLSEVLTKEQSDDLAKRVHAPDIESVTTRIEQVIQHEDDLRALRESRLAQLRGL